MVHDPNPGIEFISHNNYLSIYYMQKAENINDGIFKLYNKDCLEVKDKI